MADDPYWDNVVFLSGFEGSTIVDESPLAQTVTSYGSPALSTTQFKYGSKSLHLDGTSCISVPDNAAFFKGTDHFTVEFFLWIDPSTADGYLGLIGQWQQFTTNVGWQLNHSKRLGSSSSFFDFNIYRDATGGSPYEVLAENVVNLSTSTWMHIAIDFDGTNYRLYLDGTKVDGFTDSQSIWDATCGLFVGNFVNDLFAVNTGLIGYMDEVRVTAGVARYATDSGFTPPTEAFPRTGGVVMPGTIDDVLTDGIAMDSGAVHVLSGSSVLALGYLLDHSGVSPTSAELVLRLPAITEGIGITPLPDVVRATDGTLSDTVAVAQALVAYFGPVVVEGIGMAEALLPTMISGAVLAETLGVAELLLTATPATLADTVGVSELLTLIQGAVLADTLGISEAVLGQQIGNVVQTDSVTFSDTLLNFLGGSVAESIGINQSDTAVLLASGVLSDGIGIAESVTPMFVLRATAADTIQVNAAEALKMLFQPVVAEGIELSAAYLAPNGSLTTWVTNTRTGYVSEYDNYEFNSFARFGDKYVGATSDGIYELTGDTDAGGSIVATLKGAYLQFGDTHLSRLKAAYIAAHGTDGRFVLRIETKDGAVYDYSANTRSGRSSKVHMGKGQRARYFAYTLTSLGQDFDLDTLEFVPIALERRV